MSVHSPPGLCHRNDPMRIINKNQEATHFENPKQLNISETVKDVRQSRCPLINTRETFKITLTTGSENLNHPLFPNLIFRKLTTKYSKKTHIHLFNS